MDNNERTFTQSEVNELIGKTKKELKDKHTTEVAELNSKLEELSKQNEELQGATSEIENLKNDLENFKSENALKEKTKEFKKKLKELNVDKDTINLLSETTDVSKIEDYEQFKKFAKSDMETTPVPSDEEIEVPMTEDQTTESVYSSIISKFS